MSAAALQRALPLKAWSTLVARAALRGYQLWRSDPDDGVQRFFSGRHGLVHPLADLDAVAAWLDELDGRDSPSARAGKG